MRAVEEDADQRAADEETESNAENCPSQMVRIKGKAFDRLGTEESQIEADEDGNDAGDLRFRTNWRATARHLVCGSLRKYGTAGVRNRKTAAVEPILFES
jgi:hypothetical protein